MKNILAHTILFVLNRYTLAIVVFVFLNVLIYQTIPDDKIAEAYQGIIMNSLIVCFNIVVIAGLVSVVYFAMYHTLHGIKAIRNWAINHLNPGWTSKDNIFKEQKKNGYIKNDYIKNIKNGYKHEN